MKTDRSPPAFIGRAYASRSVVMAALTLTAAILVVIGVAIGTH